MLENNVHIIKPAANGIINEITVHLALPVSFFIVMSVVAQGQCINENSIILTAVIHVQPFEINNALSSNKLDIFTITPFSI